MKKEKTTSEVYNEHTPRWERVFWRFAFVVITLAAFMVIYIFYLLFYPRTVIQYHDDPVIVTQTHLHPGDTIPILIDYCKYQDDNGIVISQIQSKTDVYPLPQTSKSLPEGCNKIEFDGFTVPLHTRPGRYTLLYTVTYHVNILRNQSITHTSEPFDVTN